MDSLSPPTYKLHPEDSLEVDTVPFGSLRVDVPTMVFPLLRGMKSKFMVRLNIFMFVFIVNSYGGES